VSDGTTRKTHRVLYVEDAFDQALLVKAFFNALDGFSVVHSQDGDHAIESIEANGWDLLVTDLNLPGADGFSVIRTMRDRHPTVPILVTTGYTQVRHEEAALAAGADHVLVKPLDQADFLEHVRVLMSRSERLDPLDDAGDDVVLAIEGRVGDAEMGCGGTLRRAVDRGAKVVIMPLLAKEGEHTRSDLTAAGIAASILGAEIRVDRTLIGDSAGQQDLLERTINELRPGTLYVPAPDDRDDDRRRASRLGRYAAGETSRVFGYETATSHLDFRPSHFTDVRGEMVTKMEALAAYQAAGAPRVDLRPQMAQAYARYWGRLRDFTEVEAFQQLDLRT
jgi:DNA-binding response OmpR family regulator